MKLFGVVVGILAAVVLAIAVVGINRGSGPQSDGKLRVCATIFPLADWLREVAGDDAEVHLLVSGASNPHHFDPTIKDATQVTQSKALFAVGLGLDPWAAKLGENAGSGVQLIETGKWITPRPMREVQTIEVGEKHGEHDHDEDEHHHHGSSDPHFWLDPVKAREVVIRLGDELAKLDEKNAEAYRRRAAEYAAKLKELDAEVTAAATQIPKGKQLVTFHDAYGYLFERLGIKVAAVVQVSPGVEPGTRDMAEAIRIMKQIGQTVVFQEPSADTAATKIVAQELNAKIETLDPMDSEASTVGKSYVERLRHNISVLQKALGLEEKK